MSKHLEAKNKNIKDLLELVKVNPELKIVPMVETDCVPGDDYSWWVASWGKPAIEEILAVEEIIYIKSKSYEELVENAIRNIKCSEEYAKKLVDLYDWEKVIAVRIETP